MATALPSLRRSTAWLRLAEIWAYAMPSFKAGILHCPYQFSPIATAQPSLRRGTVCHNPAEIWVYHGIPHFLIQRWGKLHCPCVLSHIISNGATAQPSLQKKSLLLTIARRNHGSKMWRLRCPLWKCSQNVRKRYKTICKLVKPGKANKKPYPQYPTITIDG